MILQIIISDTLGLCPSPRRSSISGRSERKRTPVRILFGDPRRNCEGYGICKVDLGESDFGFNCQSAKVEFGVMLSQRGSDTYQLVISKNSYLRYATEDGQAFVPQFLNIPLALAREIGLRGTRFLVEAPQEQITS